MDALLCGGGVPVGEEPLEAAHDAHIVRELLAGVEEKEHSEKVRSGLVVGGDPQIISIRGSLRGCLVRAVRVSVPGPGV